VRSAEALNPTQWNNFETRAEGYPIKAPQSMQIMSSSPAGFPQSGHDEADALAEARGTRGAGGTGSGGCSSLDRVKMGAAACGGG